MLQVYRVKLKHDGGAVTTNVQSDCNDVTHAS